eukprot:1157766-Pelagomonas_calceolata.AAC.1
MNGAGWNAWLAVTPEGMSWLWDLRQAKRCLYLHALWCGRTGLTQLRALVCTFGAALSLVKNIAAFSTLSDDVSARKPEFVALLEISPVARIKSTATAACEWPHLSLLLRRSKMRASVGKLAAKVRAAERKQKVTEVKKSASQND